MTTFFSTSDDAPAAGNPAPPPAFVHQPGTDLPMMVWLRGDEELCSEFSLGAEEVMQRLGIRRSRLTQISGRELRVARMRKGRYISPAYRPSDVEAYLSWTRASASHLKSSTLVGAATDELIQHSERLSARLEQVPRAMVEEVGSQVTELATGLRQTIAEGLAALGHETRYLERAMLEGESRVKQVLHDQTLRQTELAADQEQLRSDLTLVLDSLCRRQEQLAADLQRQDQTLQELRLLLEAGFRPPKAAARPSLSAAKRIIAAATPEPGGTGSFKPGQRSRAQRSKLRAFNRG